tara:strand:+ start:119 stop:1675 length:1557 start_codon:yes stop_codon:yes gene_type:complete
LKNSIYRKPQVLIITIVLGLAIFGYTITHFYVKHKIEQLLATNLISTAQIGYSNMRINLLTSSFALDDIHITPKDSLALKTGLSIRKFQVEGVHYIKLISNGNIEVEQVLLDRVNVDYFKTDSVQKDVKPADSKFKQSILIKNFEIKNSKFRSFDAKTDSLQFYFQNVAATLANCKIDSTTIKGKIPFSFSSFNFSTGKVYASLNAYEAIHIASITSNPDHHTLITEFSLKSKYDKNKLQRRLHKERDYINLKIPRIEFKQLDFGARNDKFYVEMASGSLKNLNLEMYRNKLLPDDLTIGAMFNKTLQELPIAILVPILKVENGNIKYSELVETSTNLGEILFSEVNSVIENISTTNDKEIVFKTKAKLMGVAPIELQWSFYTEDERNLFKATGVIKNFNTQNVNGFLKSNLRAKVEGSINELYFTISGDEFSSSGDMKMKYQDFGFVVLHKDRLGVNKVLTTIGNIFTNDGSKTDEYGYRYGEISVERDPTKSFFNYLWINVKDGILDTFMGNGKKN